MNNNRFVRIYRFTLGVLISCAIITQFFTFRQSPLNFISYFTVISNLLVSFVLISLALNKTDYKNFNLLRGAATLYIIITGFGFTVLLGGNNIEFLQWVNLSLHYISPTIMFIDWVLFPPTTISFKQSLVWVVFMLVYLFYSLIRGAIINWYPYSFLNYRVVGFVGLIAYSTIITIATFLITWILTKFTRSKQL